MVTVVHCYRPIMRQQYVAGFIYIGRNWNEFEDEGWSNPYHVGPDGDLCTVIMKHRTMVENSRKTLERIKGELSGTESILGCWCAPNACHGDTLAQLANDKNYFDRVWNLLIEKEIKQGFENTKREVLFDAIRSSLPIDTKI